MIKVEGQIDNGLPVRWPYCLYPKGSVQIFPDALDQGTTRVPARNAAQRSGRLSLWIQQLKKKMATQRRRSDVADQSILQVAEHIRLVKELTRVLSRSESIAAKCWTTNPDGQRRIEVIFGKIVLGAIQPYGCNTSLTATRSNAGSRTCTRMNDNEFAKLHLDRLPRRSITDRGARTLSRALWITLKCRSTTIG